jgi:hypothetical protein
VDVHENTQRGWNIGTTWRTWHTPYPPLAFAFGARFARTSAIRVCQPAPLAFHAAMTLVATRIDSSLLGSASFGRPRRMSLSPFAQVRLRDPTGGELRRLVSARGDTAGSSSLRVHGD